MFVVYNENGIPCYSTDIEAVADRVAYYEGGYYKEEED